jgi:iron complex outermembrane receptor protein
MPRRVRHFATEWRQSLQYLFVRLHAGVSFCQPEGSTMRKNGLIVALFAAFACNAQADHVPEAGVDTIVVTGQETDHTLEAEIALTPGGTTLIDAEDLSERNVSSLADMLRYVPGIWTASGATGDSSFFSSRGSNLDATNYDGNGIKLLQDGLPVTAADGNNHNRDVDPLNTRYATVARGANALTYGASTLGGAIDFITPTARDTHPEILLNGGDNGQLQGRITWGTMAGDFDALVTVETRHWDGYRTEQHRQEREGFYANAGWQFSETAGTRIYLSYINNEQELPGALTAEEFEEDPHQAEFLAVLGNFQYNVETSRIANKTVWDIDETSRLTVGFSFEEQALYHPIVYFPGDFSLLIDTDQKIAGTSLRYNRRLGEHDLLAGLNYGQTTVEGGNYRHEDGIATDLRTLVDNDADSLELFRVDRWQFAPRWKLVYGVQAVTAGREVRETEVGGPLYNPEGDYDSINPRIGVIYQLAGHSELFANLSRLYEPPTNFELEDDASPDNEALDAMRGQVIEVGTRGSKTLGGDNRLHWEFAFYYAQLQDEILSVEDPGAPGTSLSANVDDTIHAGIEALIGASFALDAGHSFEPLLSLTVNEFSFDGDAVYGNNELPAAPGYAIKGELLYRNASGFFVGPTFDIIDERYADFSNTYTIDSYELLGLRTGYARESWEVYGEARNLTDKEYVGVFSVRDVAAPDAGILQPGEPRSVYVGLKSRF